MSAIGDREKTVLIDLSNAINSADALRLLETHLLQSDRMQIPGVHIDINTGDLLLTPGVLAKFKTVLKQFGVQLDTLYSDVPQTQQSALDEGFLVRRRPPSNRHVFELNQFSLNGSNTAELPFATPKNSENGNGNGHEVLSKLSVKLDDGREEILAAPKGASKETVFIKQNLRSGQVLEAAGNVVLVGDAHSGSEIYADGDILIWGILGGIAHAGRAGNNQSEIRAVKIEAVQLRIGQHIARRPDRLFKKDTKRQALEVARVSGGEIQIFEDSIQSV